jgi:hypothetical protein
VAFSAGALLGEIMSQTKRVLIAIAILVVLVGIVLGVEALRRRSSGNQEVAQGEPTLVRGGIPIRLDGHLVASFVPGDLEHLGQGSFVDAEEGKTQEGWFLRDVLLMHIGDDQLKASTTVVVASSSRHKSTELTWAQVEDVENSVLFDLSSRGTLKIVSVLDHLDIREEWVQDVDSIEVTSP